MGRQAQYDRDAIHRILWRRTDVHGRITFKSQELAALLGMSPYHMSRVLGEMQQAGRMQVVRVAKHSVKTYLVVDPEEWMQAV